MRIVSLLPAATEIVFALGLGDELVGVTAACSWPPEARGIPVVTTLTPLPAGAPPHRVTVAIDLEALAAARPDLVIAGGRPGGDSPDHGEAVAAVAGLDIDVTVMRLEPTSIEGILNGIAAIGAMTEAEDAAIGVVEGLRERLRAVQEIVVGRRDRGFAPPRVAALEWLDPPFAVGLWVPEQVRLAGGWEILGRPGETPQPITWDTVREVDPEILVLMPRGLDLPATLDAWACTQRPPGWSELRAVRDGRVLAVDAAAHFSRPGPRAIDGIEVLAELVDPVAFDGMAPPDSWARAE